MLRCFMRQLRHIQFATHNHKHCGLPGYERPHQPDPHRGGQELLLATLIIKGIADQRFNPYLEHIFKICRQVLFRGITGGLAGI